MVDYSERFSLGSYRVRLNFTHADKMFKMPTWYITSQICDLLAFEVKVSDGAAFKRVSENAFNIWRNIASRSCFTRSDELLYIDNLHVAYKMRGKGYGSIMMERLLSHMHKGLTAAVLVPGQPETQERLTKFYAQFGFKPLRSTPTHRRLLVRTNA